MSQQVDEVRIETAPNPAELVCIWAGPVGLIGVFGSLLIAGMLPPTPPPGWSAAQVADFFVENHLRVIIGQLLLIFSGVILTPYFAVISVTMARIEGKRPFLAVTQIAAWATLLAFFLIPTTLWIVAAYRPGEVDASVVRLLNDIAWINLLVPVMPNVLQFACVATVILMHRSADPVWPRWFGYYSIQAVLVLPVSMAIPLVHGGPFAWNGLLGFWLPAADAGVWFFSTAIFMHLAWKRRHQAALAAAATV